jgi:glyoxylase-like metal-dependent hydrolase (beta-lactamase superfamily II)
VEIETDLGVWTVHETPGHAPSHVCLHQADRRVLISGDHLLGRVSLYYDVGYSPDPAGEFLHSLDVVDELDARLCLSGHGRTFTDVRAHVDANRVAVTERLDKVRSVISDGRAPLTAFEAVPLIYGEPVTPLNANWWLNETLAYLQHLEVIGEAERIAGTTSTDPERWASKVP